MGRPCEGRPILVCYTVDFFFKELFYHAAIVVSKARHLLGGSPPPGQRPAGRHGVVRRGPRDAVPQRGLPVVRLSQVRGHPRGGGVLQAGPAAGPGEEVLRGPGAAGGHVPQRLHPELPALGRLEAGAGAPPGRCGELPPQPLAGGRHLPANLHHRRHHLHPGGLCLRPGPGYCAAHPGGQARLHHLEGAVRLPPAFLLHH